MLRGLASSSRLFLRRFALLNPASSPLFRYCEIRSRCGWVVWDSFDFSSSRRLRAEAGVSPLAIRFVPPISSFFFEMDLVRWLMIAVWWLFTSRWWLVVTLLPKEQFVVQWSIQFNSVLFSSYTLNIEH